MGSILITIILRGCMTIMVEEGLCTRLMMSILLCSPESSGPYKEAQHKCESRYEHCLGCWPAICSDALDTHTA